MYLHVPLLPSSSISPPTPPLSAPLPTYPHHTSAHQHHHHLVNWSRPPSLPPFNTTTNFGTPHSRPPSHRTHSLSHTRPRPQRITQPAPPARWKYSSLGPVPATSVKASRTRVTARTLCITTLPASLLSFPTPALLRSPLSTCYKRQHHHHHHNHHRRLTHGRCHLSHCPTVAPVSSRHSSRAPRRLD